MQVEQHPAFLKFLRQLITTLTIGYPLIAGPSAGIGDKLAALIMDWDTDPPRHAAAATETETEQFYELGAEPTLGEIRMHRIELQCEGQGSVDRLIRRHRSVADCRFGISRWFLMPAALCDVLALPQRFQRLVGARAV